MGMTAAPSGKKSGPVPGINITPLVDVALVVLIIFMVVAPMLTKTFTLTLPAEPPKDAPPPAESIEPLVMTIDADRVVRINRQVIAEGELAVVLPRMLSAAKLKVLNVDADDTVPYGEVLAVLDEARAAGAKNIAIVTKKLD